MFVGEFVVIYWVGKFVCVVVVVVLLVGVCILV